jgi:hypothetical protein
LRHAQPGGGTAEMTLLRQRDGVAEMVQPDITMVSNHRQAMLAGRILVRHLERGTGQERPA